MIRAGTLLMRTRRPVTSEVAAEAIDPESVADDHERLRAEAVIVELERPADRERDLETGEEVAADVLQADLFGGKRVSRDRRGVGIRAETDQRGKHFGIAPRRRGPRAVAGRVVLKVIASCR